MEKSAKDPEAFNQKIGELRDQMKLGGGQKRIDAQHEKGKMTARERVVELLDEGTFQEIDGFMKNRHSDFGMDKEKVLGDGMVAGFGKIDGRRVCIYAQDFTVMGGSFGEIAGQKVAHVMDLAIEAGVPVIGLNDGGGARIQESVFSLAAFGELFYRNTQASGVIPQISVILGPCAGGAVYSPALTDFIVMAKGISNMFITGPEVIKTVTGEEVDAETLGGAEVHSAVSGVAHFSVNSEAEAFTTVKKLLSYLPSNNTEAAPITEMTDDPWRMDSELDTLVPTDPSASYNMINVINHVFDYDSFFEIQAAFAQNAIIGFARLAGLPLGVVAQQPAYMAGAIDINAADKMARFIRFCDAFNFPIVTFSDSPGFLPGVSQEHGGIIRHGAKIVYAYSEASVPKLTVITRKGYGGAYIVMASKHIHSDMVFAWPSAEIAVMGAEGAVSILYRKELQGKENAAEERTRLVDEFREKFANPYFAAANGFVDDVILPHETRVRLITGLELLHDKKVHAPAKKHGCMPL